MEQKAEKYINSLYVDYGDLNDKAEEQIKQAFIDGMKEQFAISGVISRLKERLEINAGRLAEPLLKQGKQPKEDKDCDKAFLMLAHLAEIEDYLNGL